MELDEIIEGCYSDSRRHQEALYNLYSSKMFGVCLTYTSDREAAKDILHDGFFKVFRKFSLFNPEKSVEVWIRIIVVNTAIDYLRKQNKLRKVEWEEQDHAIVNNGAECSTGSDLQQIIAMIPIGAKTVFNLYAIEGYKHEEIAQKLGISIGTSKSQFSRARRLLKELLSKHYVI